MLLLWLLLLMLMLRLIMPTCTILLLLCKKSVCIYKNKSFINHHILGYISGWFEFFFFFDSRVGFYSWAQENASYPISLKKCHVGVQSFPCSTVCLVPELVFVRRLKKGLFFFFFQKIDFLVQLRNTLSYRLDGSRFLVPNLNPWIQKTNWISLVHIEG